jgi:outer membrane protein assembly factor BamA
MQRGLPILVMWVWMLASGVCSGQGTSASHTVLVREIHISGEPGGTQKALGEYTDFLVGHRMEEKEILKEAESAVGAFLRHRGFLKARVTPKVRPANTFGNSKDVVVLVIRMEIGNRYRAKGITFSGLSHELEEPDLKQACKFQEGDIADAEEASNCVTNLVAAFHQKGQDVNVITQTIFDDTLLTVVFGFDIEK